MDPYIWHELVLSSKYPVSSVAVLGGGLGAVSALCSGPGAAPLH